MSKKNSVTFLALTLLLLALVGCAHRREAATSRFDQAVDELIAQGYPEEVVSHLNSLGTSELGYRLGGTSAGNAGAEYLAEQMREMGLSNVRLEPVPLDAWEIKGASVSVDGRSMICSQFPGVPPTPTEGITAEVVYVKGGAAADYKGKNVEGKIVLVDLMMDSWWLNLPAHEATVQGAAAIVFTFNPEDPSYYSFAPDTLGSNDGIYGFAWAPAVYLARQDGDWLKAELASGPVTATVKSDVEVTHEDQGGVGYNVVGELPGESGTDEKVVIAAHHDAYFRAGMDDTSGSAQALTLAKTMKLSGYRPQRTVVFFLTTGEEFGYTNANYDYLVGSSYSITHTHADWPGTVAGVLNLEAQGGGEGKILIRASPELRPWIQGILEANPQLAPYGTDLEGVSSWTDGFPFATSGIPNATLSAEGAHYEGRYHTNYDVQELIDWEHFGSMAKLEFRLAEQLDRRLLLYNLEYQAADLAASVNEQVLEKSGVDAEVVSRFIAAVGRYQEAAGAYETRKDSISANRHAALDTALLNIEKALGANFTALAPGEAVIYPHQHLLEDTANIQKALEALRPSHVDPKAALEALAKVYLMQEGLHFSEPVYQTAMAWMDPNYERIGFGGAAHVVPPIDVLPEYRQVEAGNYSAAIAGLTEKNEAQLEELNARLSRMSEVLEEVTPQIEALR
jgi:Iap family predicted aminopeptidase